MKLIPAATLALAVAIEAKAVADPSEPVVGPLALSNPRFADGTWNPRCGPPEKAIDGAGIGLPDLYHKPELVHSKSGNNPEFLVDLPANAAVSEVVFYPRNSIRWQDHYLRYQALTVSVGDTLCEAEQGLGPDDVKSRIFTGLKWNCNFAEGDSISVKNKNFIHFTELTAAGYIKPSGPIPANYTAKALSLSNPHFSDGLFFNWNFNMDFEPMLAIDGSEYTGMTHSLTGQNPTFLVDLPNSNAIVERVIIYPRRDCCFERYSQLKVKIDNIYCKTDQSLDANTISHLHDGEGIVFQCNTSVKGSTIIVENANYLHFTEIQAFGFEALSLSNARFDDGLFYTYNGNEGFPPELAIDGIIAKGNIAHSLTEQNPSFLVDLPNSETFVGKLIIYPRQDCCFEKYSQMKVRIGDNYCETDQSLDVDTIHSLVNGKAGVVFQCNIINGSTITVEQNENNYLHFTEIEAFGFSLA